MSGYCGMLRTDGVAVQEDFLQGITGNPAFRGPDGSCIQAKEPLGFSFSFLERGPSRQARRQPALRNPRTRSLFCSPGRHGAKLVCRSFLVIFLSVLWDAEEKSFCCRGDFGGCRSVVLCAHPGSVLLHQYLASLAMHAWNFARTVSRRGYVS